MKKLNYYHILVFCQFLLTDTIAQNISTPFETKSISINTDQDIFGPDNEDRNYTLGFELNTSFSKLFESKNYFILPCLRKCIDKAIGLDYIYTANNTKYFVSNLSLLGSGFTPLNIGTEVIDSLDRPYGSILSLGSTRITVFNEDAVFDEEHSEFPHKYAISTSFFIGALGLNLANSIQSYIHRNHWFGSTRPIPEGWKNQISNGGELTGLYSISVITPYITLRNNGFKLLESTIDVTTQIGYYTNFALGINTKLGKFDSEYWYLNNLLTNASQKVLQNKHSNFKWNIGFSLRARYVIYNALLQGQFKKSVYELSSDQITRILLEATFGIDILLFERLNLTFRPISIRTAEFKDAGRNHSWGMAGLSFNFR